MFLAPSQNLFSEFRIQSSSLSILPITFQEYFLSCHLHFVLQRNEEILPLLQGAACEHTLSLTSHVSPCQEAQTQNQSQTCSPGRSPRFSLRLGAGYFVFPMINKDHESYPRLSATCTRMLHLHRHGTCWICQRYQINSTLAVAPVPPVQSDIWHRMS